MTTDFTPLIDFTQYRFVLIEHGEPVAVASTNKEELVMEWAKQGEGRAAVKVEEWT